MSQELKVRYSDEDLQEFKVLIEGKLQLAQDELNTTQQQIDDLNENGFNQQGGDWYDDSTAHTDLEMLQRMLTRQQRHVQDLKNALLRVQNKTYGILHFMDDDVLTEHGHIDPSKIIPHDWKKLSSLWKSINTEYRAALTRFTQSGTHDHNFYAFCNGKVETYYLRKYLELRPNTNAAVEADLPEECAVSSDVSMSQSSHGSVKKK